RVAKLMGVGVGSLRGRPKIPTAIAILRGNPGRRPHDPDEPLPAVISRMPSPPAHFGEEERAIWFREGHRLMDSRVITLQDLNLFQDLTWWTYIRDRCEMEMRDQPLTLRSKSGGYMHPLMTTHAMASKQVRELATHFGLSPLARTKVKTVDSRQESI